MINKASKFLEQVKDEQKMFWRNIPAAFFTFFITLLFVFLLGGFSGRGQIKDFGNIKPINYFLPAVITLGIISACYTSFAMTIAHRRDSGVLKRIEKTPTPKWAYIGALIVSNAINAILITLLCIILSVLIFHASFPHHIIPLILALFLGIVAFSAIGAVVSMFIPNAEAAPAIVNAIMLPIYFASGTVFVLQPNSFLAKLMNYLPIRRFSLSLLYAFDSSGHYGASASLQQDIVVAIWAFIGLVIAIRKFRWS